MTATKTACPRCLGNANAFLKFSDINGGRCLLCNGVGASRAGSADGRPGKAVDLGGFRFPDGWITKDRGAYGQDMTPGNFVVTCLANEADFKTGSYRGDKVRGQARFEVRAGVVTVTWMPGGGWKAGDREALTAALQNALKT